MSWIGRMARGFKPIALPLILPAAAISIATGTYFGFVAAASAIEADLGVFVALSQFFKFGLGPALAFCLVLTNLWSFYRSE